MLANVNGINKNPNPNKEETMSQNEEITE